MSETIDPGAEKFSEENHPGEGGLGFKMKVRLQSDKLKDGLRDNFLTILLGSVVISFLAGYFISRQQEAQKREQWAEILFRHAKDWLSSTAEQASCRRRFFTVCRRRTPTRTEGSGDRAGKRQGHGRLPASC
jgi:hypothetical protein